MSFTQYNPTPSLPLRSTFAISPPSPSPTSSAESRAPRSITSYGPRCCRTSAIARRSTRASRSCFSTRRVACRSASTLARPKSSLRCSAPCAPQPPDDPPVCLHPYPNPYPSPSPNPNPTVALALTPTLSRWTPLRYLIFPLLRALRPSATGRPSDICTPTPTPTLP